MGLFKPAWKSQNYTKRTRRSIDRVKSEAKLVEIAMTAPNLDTRCYAVHKMTDQTIIADLAKNHEEIKMRCAAVMRLIDKRAIEDIAINDPAVEVRHDAVRSLTWERDLSGAIKVLTNLAILQDIARYSKWEHERDAAILRRYDLLEDKTQATQAEINAVHSVWYKMGVCYKCGGKYEKGEWADGWERGDRYTCTQCGYIHDVTTWSF